MDTIRKALAEGRIRKLALHTEYGRIVLYSGEEPAPDTEYEAWILDERDKYVVRCRVSWYTYADSTVEVYGEAQADTSL